MADVAWVVRQILSVVCGDVFGLWIELHALKIRLLARMQVRQRIREYLNELAELVNVLEASAGKRLRLEVAQTPLRRLVYARFWLLRHAETLPLTIVVKVLNLVWGCNQRGINSFEHVWLHGAMRNDVGDVVRHRVDHEAAFI